MRTAIIVFLLSVVLCPEAGASDDDFRLSGASGDAAVWPAGADAPSPATVGLPLQAGDRLVTGKSGRVEVAGKNGTVIQLQENSAFSIGEPAARWTSFRLSLGRLVARFAPSAQRPYRVTTPVAVAAIRGTELILDVGDTGALQAGVVEGEVSFEPTTESEVPMDAPDGGPAAAPVWAPETISTAGGIEVAPHETPRRLAEIPPLLRPAMASFPAIRDRVPALRRSWTDLPPSERQALRRAAFRERLRWDIPARIRDRMVAPGQRVAPGSVPDRRPVARPSPPPRRLSPPAPRRPARRSKD